MSTLTIIIEPTSEPVTLNEAKESIKVEDTDDDARILGMIVTARRFAEAFCNIKIFTQVVERSYDRFPSSEIDLGVWPLQSIDSVKYDDTASPVTEQTLVADTDYYADTTTIGGRVRTITGWPSVAVKPNPVRIRMTAGYTTVPDYFKEGVLAYVAYLFDGESEMATAAKSILSPYRILSL